jgi:hypothetical protein
MLIITAAAAVNGLSNCCNQPQCHVASYITFVSFSELHDTHSEACMQQIGVAMVVQTLWHFPTACAQLCLYVKQHVLSYVH